MTIASEITKLNTNLEAAYTAVDSKGGTLPASQNFDNLATAVNSIIASNNTTLSVTPTTSAQNLTPSSPYNGFNSVSVSAVTSSIDSNISADNIKSGVSILGVNGSVTELKGETRSVSITSTAGNTFTPSSGKNGITSITVTPNNQARTVTPTTSSQNLTVNSGYSGNGTITINAVTSSIDSNITAENIKSGVSILGVTGSYEGSGGSGIPREVKNGVYQLPTEDFTFSLPNNATDVGAYGLYYAFNGCPALTSVDLSSLTTVSGSLGLYNAFQYCTSLTSVDLSSLTTVSGDNGLYNAFQNCPALTSVDLSSLTTVSGDHGLAYTFYYCSGLTSVDFPSLTTVSANQGLAYAFKNCTRLTNVYFRSLKTSSFGSYKNQFDRMMTSTGTSKTHTIHFPSNLQSTISGLSGYPLFGGTSGYVVLSFDLPATS